MLELGCICVRVVWDGGSWGQDLRKQILEQHWNQNRVTANVPSVLCVLHQAQGLFSLGQRGWEKTNLVVVTHTGLTPPPQPGSETGLTFELAGWGAPGLLPLNRALSLWRREEPTHPQGAPQ